jgi:hypothetical protein
MSYEGYEEYLTEKGVYLTIDCYDSVKRYAHITDNDPIKWGHSVDVTNGEGEEGCLWTRPAPKEPIGFQDHWFTDHYGNKYAVMDTLFAPHPDAIKEFGWRPYNGE